MRELIRAAFLFQPGKEPLQSPQRGLLGLSQGIWYVGRLARLVVPGLEPIIDGFACCLHLLRGRLRAGPSELVPEGVEPIMNIILYHREIVGGVDVLLWEEVRMLQLPPVV
jgi:hypothetical protein